MDIKEAIQSVVSGKNLSADTMLSVMNTIMSGNASPAQIGGFLVALRIKGETIEEITAAAKVMRDLSEKVVIDLPNMVDTCGTGGDASGTFNVSTASAIVAAAAGAAVAKHGNRSVSSKSGSADLLEVAGANLELTADQVAQCIRACNIGFMFAPLHHGAMKHAIGPRRELGMRTIFNVLGPLTNPAGAGNQVLGVFDPSILKPLATVLQNLGSQHVMVVHGDGGMDEISISGPTQVAELKNDQIVEYAISPDSYGLPLTSIDDIRVSDSSESLTLIESAFANQAGPAKDAIVLNAGAAIYVSGIENSLEDGIQRAAELIANGAAAEKFAQFIKYTNSF